MTGGGGSSTITYPAPSSGNPVLVGDDTGREITSITIGGTPVAFGSSTYTADFPNGLFVGTVSDSGELYPTNSGGPTVAASFQAIDDAGNPVSITGTVTSVTLSGEGDPALLVQLVDADGAGHRRPAVRRHGPDHRWWRHGKRPHQPVHRAGLGVHDLLQPLQLAADDGGPLRRVQLHGHLDRRQPPDGFGVRGPRRRRSHRLRRPDWARAFRDGRLHRPEWERVHAPHPHQPRRGTP